MFRIDARQVGWRLVDGCALIVCRSNSNLYRLNHVGTEIWRTLASAPLEANFEADSVSAAASPLTPAEVARFLVALQGVALVEGTPNPPAADQVSEAKAGTGAARRSPAPRLRQLSSTTELVAEIQLDSDASLRPIGDSVFLRSPAGDLSLLSGPAATVLDRLRKGRCAFVDLWDVLCDQCGLTDEEAEACLPPLLERLASRRMISGIAPLERLLETGHGERLLGRLALMEGSDGPLRRPNFGFSPIINDAADPPGHVAIVCQYGIVGFALGIDSYVRRCIGRLRAFDPDLIVLSGGGRHGLAVLREAESVVERYRNQFPQKGLWVERHSSTSWQNLTYSLDMLRARAIIPRRITLVGDRARTEKLRLAVWLAKRRFPEFRHVSFRIVTEQRERATWRDQRAAQLVGGFIQVFTESQAAPPIAPTHLA